MAAIYGVRECDSMFDASLRVQVVIVYIRHNAFNQTGLVCIAVLHILRPLLFRVEFLIL